MTATTTRPSTDRDGPPGVPPGAPSEVIELRPAPALPPGESLLQGLALSALPMVGSLGSVAFVATSGHGSTQSYAAAGMFLVASLGFVAANLWRTRSGGRGRCRAVRRDYLGYLARIRAQARAGADAQRQQLTWSHPEPAALAVLVEDGARLWERTEAPRVVVRYGRSTQPSSPVLHIAESDALDEVDPLCDEAVRRLVAVHREQPHLPSVVALDDLTDIEVTGRPDDVRAVARAMIVHAATFHCPDRLVVAVVAGHRTLEHWDWVKWLPHSSSRQLRDAGGGTRLVAATIDELAPLLFAQDPRATGRPPHLVLVVDGAEAAWDHPLLPSGGRPGLTVLRLEKPRVPVGDRDDAGDCRVPAVSLDLRPSGRGAVSTDVTTTADGVTTHGQADLLGLTGAEATARRLLGAWARRLRSGDPGTLPGRGLTDLLGLGDVRALDPARSWRSRPTRDLLRVPLGTGPNGEVVHLDLKESAEQGAGPHGLLIGATGSGKSELLRTLVLGLALTHSPEVLNLVLVDFKGGATFAGMSRLPHVSAMITNLSDELTLVDRMQDALSGELTRRQELLRASGGHSSQRDYERARTSGESPDLAPLPTLLVVCDEFSELLSAKPELVDLFVAVGRLGRSLGVHLLLASQRLEEGRLRGLDSHLSYRLALRTFSAAESRAVIGVPDAYELPAVPGIGLLRDDPTSLRPFTAAYVSGPASRAVTPSDGAGGGHGRRAHPPIVPFVTGTVAQSVRGEATTGIGPLAAGGAGAAMVPAAPPSLLDVAVAAMAGHGPPAHRIWLPPLDVPDTLDALLPHRGPDGRRAGSPLPQRSPSLRIPLGTLDRPREQRREVLWADLSGPDGHVAVVGAPRSGRSTVLRTIVVGLALTHTAAEVQVYVLDFGGGSFTALRDLPHVAGVGTRTEPEVVSRIVAEVTTVLDDRERFFRAHGVDGIEGYRARRAVGGLGGLDDGWGDVVLVIDGWGTLRTELPDLEPQLQSIGQRGLTFGVHLVTSATRWMDYRASLRDVLGTRVELRLGDPMDSEIDRRLAATVPAGRPGRGLVTSGHHFLAALPRIDADPSTATLAAGICDVVAQVAGTATGPPAPRLRLLPVSVDLEQTRRLAPTCPLLLLGLGERDLRPVGLDVAQDPHLLVLGEARSGKSATLRTYLNEVRRLHTPESAQVFLVDYRRSHLGEVPDEWVADCATTADRTAELARGLAAFLAERLPGPDVSPAQLRARSWWQGREAYVVVDDHELVTASHTNPLEPLVPLLARATDVGLHVVVARRSGGFGRVHDGLLTALRDLAQPALVLSGDPSEGPVLGNLRPGPAPAGRGRLLTRDGVESLQVAWSAPVAG